MSLPEKLFLLKHIDLLESIKDLIILKIKELKEEELRKFEEYRKNHQKESEEFLEWYFFGTYDH